VAGPTLRHPPALH
jgi:hypothetical protein